MPLLNDHLKESKSVLLMLLFDKYESKHLIHNEAYLNEKTIFYKHFSFIANSGVFKEKIFNAAISISLIL